MPRKKIVVERKPLKIKKKRKISEEQKEKLRKRLEVMRAKKKPAEYKNIHKSVLALPDDDRYSFKNVKEWIKESKDLVAQYSRDARRMSNTPQDKQKAQNAADNKKAYIRYCEHYLKTGDWIGMFSGKEETTRVIPKCIAMAYHADGTPKRSVGVFYEDIMMVWSQDMDESEFADTREGVISNPLAALTDKQFTSST